MTVLSGETKPSLPPRQLLHYLFDPELGSDKMLFISGPRQVGKTTLARKLIPADQTGGYHSWDNPATRRAYAADPFFFLKGHAKGPRLVVFDEIHKRTKWKDILKGLYDSMDKEIRLIVTGSARLEWFRKSGDSLVGRYLHYHMLPLSLSEVLGNTHVVDEPLLDKLTTGGKLTENGLFAGAAPSSAREALDHLLVYGGFPEPFTMSSQRFLRKWRDDYLSLIVREDVRDLAKIGDLDRMEQLMMLLPSRTGSLLSYSSLGKDLEIGYRTVQSSIRILETLWLVYLIRPWHRRMHRVLRKEPKCYLTDWSAIPSGGVRFENLVASHLLKASTVYTDRGFGDYGLFFLRNFDGNEVDFLVAKDGKPMLLVEAKEGDTDISRPTLNLAAQTGAPLVQIVNRPGIFRKVSDLAWVVSADKFLSVLP